MQTIKTAGSMREWSLRQEKKGLRVALVPTMGCLHAGHLSLVDAARRLGDRVVVSIYVNPAQFAANEDFRKYPRNIRRDARMLADAGADVLFNPSNLYGREPRVTVDPGPMQEVLCGKSRPGHFRGVATVVMKLFNIVRPYAAVFGQKDAQQFAILDKMVADLDMPVRMVAAPIVRERDGLAMSSRNVYLTPGERGKAPSLYRALEAVAADFRKGRKDARAVLKKASSIPEGRLEYFEAVDGKSLAPVMLLRKGVLVAAAMRLGRTRLIDNIILE